MKSTVAKTWDLALADSAIRGLAARAFQRSRKIKTKTLRRTSRRLVRNVNYPLTQTGISNNDFLSLGLFNPPIYQLSSRKPWLLHSDSRPCKKWGMPKWASLTENNLSQTSAFWFFSYQRNRMSTAKVKKVAIGFEKFSFLSETKQIEAEFCQKKNFFDICRSKKKMPSTSILVLVPFFLTVAVVGVFCYPVERRKFMLYNARVNVVLTGETRYSKIKLKNEFAF